MLAILALFAAVHNCITERIPSSKENIPMLSRFNRRTSDNVISMREHRYIRLSHNNGQAQVTAFNRETGLLSQTCRGFPEVTLIIGGSKA